ncbi:MAG: Rieske 2Fe-2S domain-containing protein, partial [Dehalococcoidia bacterium]|nr:Rieske 2Fe-2S domain-containing protein [Dehalococcoidia bacterium]
MTRTIERLLNAGSVEEVRARGCTVVTGGGHAIAVFPIGDRFAAVDNRCPHMGFPLDRGTVSNGILTCHWHHARFDLSSGGTFDPFADDVGSFPVTVSGGRVWVDPSPPQADAVERWSSRLK